MEHRFHSSRKNSRRWSFERARLQRLWNEIHAPHGAAHTFSPAYVDKKRNRVPNGTRPFQNSIRRFLRDPINPLPLPLLPADRYLNRVELRAVVNLVNNRKRSAAHLIVHSPEILPKYT